MSLLNRLKELETVIQGDRCAVCCYDPRHTRVRLRLVAEDAPHYPDEGRACPVCGFVEHRRVLRIVAGGRNDPPKQLERAVDGNAARHFVTLHRLLRRR